MGCLCNSLGHQSGHLSIVMSAVISTRLIIERRHSHVPLKGKARNSDHVQSTDLQLKHLFATKVVNHHLSNELQLKHLFGV
jgi:hypothetical protein